MSISGYTDWQFINEIFNVNNIINMYLWWWGYLWQINDVYNVYYVMMSKTHKMVMNEWYIELVYVCN